MSKLTREVTARLTFPINASKASLPATRIAILLCCLAIIHLAGIWSARDNLASQPQDFSLPQISLARPSAIRRAIMDPEMMKMAMDAMSKMTPQQVGSVSVKRQICEEGLCFQDITAEYVANRE